MRSRSREKRKILYLKKCETSISFLFNYSSDKKNIKRLVNLFKWYWWRCFVMIQFKEVIEETSFAKIWKELNTLNILINMITITRWDNLYDVEEYLRIYYFLLSWERCRSSPRAGDTEREIGPSDPSKGLPSPLGCWVLPLSAVWDCVGKESEGSFLPGYVMLSFQTLILSSGQLKADYPVWNKTTSTPD